MSNPLTIVLADDHAVVRSGLRTLLERSMPCTVVGEAGNGPEALALVERLQPILLVVDLMMPGLSGLEVARQVRQTAPQTRIVILSMHADESYVREALRVGVTAYVLKEALSTDFIYALQQAALGRRYLSPPSLRRRSMPMRARRPRRCSISTRRSPPASARSSIWLPRA